MNFVTYLIVGLGAALISATGAYLAAKRTSKASEVSAEFDRQKERIGEEMALLLEGREMRKELRDETRALSVELHHVRDELKQAQGEAADLRVELSRARAELERLRSDLHEAHEENEALRTRLVVLKDKK